MNAIAWYRTARWLYLRHIPFLPRLLYYGAYILFNCSVPYTADIGSGTTLGYGGMGIVIHSRAKIGQNCLISQQVTIGGRSREYRVPVIGDRVLIGAGAKVLGYVTIGNDCVVGANAVVVHDVPDGCVAAGIPAKIIKQGIDIGDYMEL